MGGILKFLGILYINGDLVDQALRKSLNRHRRKFSVDGGQWMVFVNRDRAPTGTMRSMVGMVVGQRACVFFKKLKFSDAC